MTPIKQGEKLMLLVKRDSRNADAMAEALGVDKSYLPKLYKMDKLPRKPLQKAVEVFQVAESYFTGRGEELMGVAEPTAAYRTATQPGSDAKLSRLQEENAILREEVARLTKMLEHEQTTSANLAEALMHLSKRG